MRPSRWVASKRASAYQAMGGGVDISGTAPRSGAGGGGSDWPKPGVSKAKRGRSPARACIKGPYMSEERAVRWRRTRGVASMSVGASVGGGAVEGAVVELAVGEVEVGASGWAWVAHLSRSSWFDGLTTGFGKLRAGSSTGSFGRLRTRSGRTG